MPRTEPEKIDRSLQNPPCPCQGDCRNLARALCQHFYTKASDARRNQRMDQLKKKQVWPDSHPSEVIQTASTDSTDSSEAEEPRPHASSQGRKLITKEPRIPTCLWGSQLAGSRKIPMCRAQARRRATTRSPSDPNTTRISIVN